MNPGFWIVFRNKVLQNRTKFCVSWSKFLTKSRAYLTQAPTVHRASEWVEISLTASDSVLNCKLFFVTFCKPAYSHEHKWDGLFFHATGLTWLSWRCFILRQLSLVWSLGIIKPLVLHLSLLIYEWPQNWPIHKWSVPHLYQKYFVYKTHTFNSLKNSLYLTRLHSVLRKLSMFYSGACI